MKYLIPILILLGGCTAPEDRELVNGQPRFVYDFTLDDGTRCVFASRGGGGGGLQCDWND